MELEIAIEAVLSFLRASQSTVGYWSDWSLPLGESRMWTTAYTGYRLSAVAGRSHEFVQAMLEPAANWLAEAELPGGGWGYNEQASPDADSTALAILFLNAQGRPVSECSYACLRGYQNEDGGFSTYTAGQNYGAWTSSHTDVTAMAIQALLTRHERDDACIRNAARFVLQREMPEGIWNSYWWNTPLYATEAILRCLAPGTSSEGLVGLRPTNAFETALLLLCLSHAEVDTGSAAIAELTSALLSRQLDDGSWPSTPMLRLPPRDCSEPWKTTESVPLYTDQNRIFTSVTVVASLRQFAVGPKADWLPSSRPNASGLLDRGPIGAIRKLAWCRPATHFPRLQLQ